MTKGMDVAECLLNGDDHARVDG